LDFEAQFEIELEKAWEDSLGFFWGLRPYLEIDQLQKRVLKLLQESGRHSFILGGEFKPTITCGIRSRPEHILNPQDFEVHQIKRGGETTLHSPGQLVIYPIFNLRELKWGVRDFVCHLLKTSARVYQEFGLPTRVSEEPVGLFTEKGKIGFCGLQIQGGISQHGLALNIRNDLSLFNSIVSCGLHQISYDKLENKAPDITVEQFFSRWVQLASLEGSHQRSQNQAPGFPVADCRLS
jgi:lipoyl(octanoyl) transferase